MTNDFQLYQQAMELLELIEDSVEHYCDENIISGQKVWSMIESMAEAKLDEFPTHTWKELGEVE